MIDGAFASMPADFLMSADGRILAWTDGMRVTIAGIVIGLASARRSGSVFG